MVIDTEQEKREIISRYRRLLRKAKPILKDGDAKLIKKAFTISLEAHKDMRRKSGEPFIFHPSKKNLRSQVTAHIFAVK